MLRLFCFPNQPCHIYLRPQKSDAFILLLGFTILYLALSSGKFFQLFLKKTFTKRPPYSQLVKGLFLRGLLRGPWKQNNHSSDTFQSGGESLSRRWDTPRPTCPKGRLRIARWTANPGHTQMLGCSKHGDETLWDNDTERCLRKEELAGLREVWVEPISQNQKLREELRGWYRVYSEFVENSTGNRFFMGQYSSKWIAFDKE